MIHLKKEQCCLFQDGWKSLASGWNYTGTLAPGFQIDTNRKTYEPAKQAFK